MRPLYRLQQVLALTSSELNVLVGLACLFGLGLGARYVGSAPRGLPPPPAEAHAAFTAAATADLPADAALQPTPAAPEAPASGRRTRRAPAGLPATPIDLNTAPARELERLPRIGPKLAARIVAYRDAHGPFRRVRDLTRVKGIGAKTLARLEPHLTIAD